MSTRSIVAVLLVSMLWVPAVAGDHVEQVETYEDNYIVLRGHADEQDAFRLADDATCDVINPVCQEPRYRTDATISVWEETNGCEGLQERRIDCNGDDSFEQPDTLVFRQGCLSGATDPCGQTELI